jgi:SAM-dependent methyltransferase
VFDSVVMIRVIHHIVAVPRALQNIRAVLQPGGVFVFEFANKRNLKALARYLMRRQKWSPFDQKPIEFVALNFDFHPVWMKRQLREAGFAVRQTRAVSTFRMGALKRLFGAQRLAAIDGALQRPLAAGRRAEHVHALHFPGPSPSRNRRWKREGGLRLPICRAVAHSPHDELRLGHRWSAHDGIYDSKTPVVHCVLRRKTCPARC